MDIFKLIQDNALLFTIGMLLSVLIYTYQVKEGFASASKRYMWQYVPMSRNSSYDIRGELEYVDGTPTYTGVFSNTALEGNYTNQRLLN